VPIDEQRFEYVGFWARVAASAVDMLLSTLLLAPLLNALYQRPTPPGIGEVLRSPEVASALLLDAVTPHGAMDVVLDYVVPAAVVLVFWLARQATPGKMLIRARIVDAETMAKPAAGRLLVRYLGYYVDFLSLGLGFVWVAFDRRKQGWHDKLAGTVVVRERSGRTINQ
jgi:uncharacterized RDD family membrane protein YckC